MKTNTIFHFWNIVYLLTHQLSDYEVRVISQLFAFWLE